MSAIEVFFNEFAAFMWGKPLVALIVLGGLFFMLYSRFLPYKYLPHAIDILRGKYNKAGGHGDISHFQALATALSGTLGLGNITGVALAITIGGPGAVFWMWVTAIVGMATKFFTASLAIMYRGYDSKGHLQGGPMYVIREGLGRKWIPLAILFAFAGLMGTLPVFQINQLIQIIRDMVAVPAGLTSADDHFLFDLIAGLLMAGLVLAIISGRIQRIADVTSRLVPLMVVFYVVMTTILLVMYAENIPEMLTLIVTDAFSGKAAAGGAVGAVILIGVQRGAFSNEAGIGTESLAHGAAKTDYPTREGLVAMLGPVIDTLIVCTCTALAILVTGVWQGDANGVSLTGSAFEAAFPGLGGYLLTVMVFFLAISTMLSFWYYGSKCTGFLIGAEREHYYVWFYVALIVVGAVASLKAVIGLIDGMYAVMAIPTMTSTLLLAPRVMERARIYFRDLDKEHERQDRDSSN
ncbi:amino acid carrier protein [Emcibacter sp.]|uniref:alanine/glycine:cation symporter family protein n=1 Tax=Emcibacter sp. TaxID=1979954 RepID=UPI002AA5FB7F|nr:amino acid carrier protein [Emcibacter sp.]